MGEVYIFCQAVQCGLIILVLLLSVISNCSIVLNIVNSDIKKSIVTFVIIKNLCIADCIGACLVLPAPLAATFRGRASSSQYFH